MGFEGAIILVGFGMYELDITFGDEILEAKS